MSPRGTSKEPENHRHCQQGRCELKGCCKLTRLNHMLRETMSLTSATMSKVANTSQSYLRSLRATSRALAGSKSGRSSSTSRWPDRQSCKQKRRHLVDWVCYKEPVTAPLHGLAHLTLGRGRCPPSTRVIRRGSDDTAAPPHVLPSYRSWWRSIATVKPNS
ncbi:uncharacterized protein [Triticum aestivum]|uniref:uncharacterized protein n=1 Tax=Triticum aestivum TaxID=4565 RepID=UPI001D027D61|nr:uncharacterized protein LOC123097372 [Triticum aestivum]